MKFMSFASMSYSIARNFTIIYLKCYGTKLPVKHDAYFRKGKWCSNFKSGKNAEGKKKETLDSSWDSRWSLKFLINKKGE